MALYFVAEEQAANAEALVGKNAMSGFLAVMNAAPVEGVVYAAGVLRSGCWRACGHGIL